MTPAADRKQMKHETIIHPIPPLYRENSKILILGSFPSVKSRESAFFYGHPQNRFWKVMAAVFEDSVPSDVPQKRAFLIRHRIAAWDVIHSCTIRGSSDSERPDGHSGSRADQADLCKWEDCGKDVPQIH